MTDFQKRQQFEMLIKSIREGIAAKQVVPKLDLEKDQILKSVRFIEEAKFDITKKLVTA